MEMATMALSFWTCPSCKRRVPGSLESCRCGFPKAQAVRLQVVEAQKTEIPWQVKAFLAALVVVVVIGVVELFRPAAPTKIIPLLGYMDPPRPSPKPYSPFPARAPRPNASPQKANP
jgi:hypothetical protein